MSSIYIHQPKTSGKVQLKTNYGNINIELWVKECPKACRNFVQLCLEGYYDNNAFHKIDKNIGIFTGDPSGTGEGGESVFTGNDSKPVPFETESHSRLKFVNRGMVAMSSEDGYNKNKSQFFITVKKTEHLNGRKTIFGKVPDKTIFNVLRMSELEVDENWRPMYPPKIISTEVLENPFDDIVPRRLKKPQTSDEGEKERKKKERKKRLLKTKKLNLMDDEDEEESMFQKKKKKKRKKKKKKKKGTTRSFNLGDLMEKEVKTKSDSSSSIVTPPPPPQRKKDEKKLEDLKEKIRKKINKTGSDEVIEPPPPLDHEKANSGGIIPLGGDPEPQQQQQDENLGGRKFQLKKVRGKKRKREKDDLSSGIGFLTQQREKYKRRKLTGDNQKIRKIEFSKYDSLSILKPKKLGKHHLKFRSKKESVDEDVYVTIDTKNEDQNKEEQI